MKRASVAGFIAGLLCICAVFPWGVTAAFAGIEPVPWIPTTGGFDNPVFWVLFNPQPEPPGHQMQVSTNPQGELVFTSPYGPDGLRLLFGASGPAGLFDGIFLSKTPDGFTSLLLSGTQLLYRADFTFASSGMLFPGSAVMFNPQPEPPGAPDLRAWVTFDLRDAAGGPVPMFSDVNMTLRLTDANGDVISLRPAPIPEPATMLLFGAGVAGLAMIRLRMKK